MSDLGEGVIVAACIICFIISAIALVRALRLNSVSRCLVRTFSTQCGVLLCWPIFVAGKSSFAYCLRLRR